MYEKFHIQRRKFLELKNQPYFDGINWEQTTQRQNDPPFEASEITLNDEHPLNVESLFGDRADDKLDESILEKFSSKWKLYKNDEFSFHSLSFIFRFLLCGT